MKIFAWARRGVQMLVVAGLCVLPWLNAAELRQISGSFFALDFFGIPFADPVGAAQVAATGLLPGERLLAGALISLALSLALGRVFCSWICPYGFFSELAHWLRGRQGGTYVKEGRAFAGKVLLLGVGLAAALVAGFPALGIVSLPGELSLLPMLVWQGGDFWLLFGAVAVPLAALMLELVAGKRLWCRFVCPQSVLLGAAARCLPPKAPGLRIGWQAANCTCKGKAPCQQACSLELNPRRKGGPGRRDCTHCGDCVNTCASYGKALEWRGMRCYIEKK